MIEATPFQVVVDTGPLVAILEGSQEHHQTCREVLQTLRPPLLTTWPVVTEAAWLLRHSPRALDGLYRAEAQGLIRIVPIPDFTLERFGRLAEQFQSLRPQLADLSLLYLTEQRQAQAIFTLDRRDFLVMQSACRQNFVLLPATL